MCDASCSFTELIKVFTNAFFMNFDGLWMGFGWVLDGFWWIFMDLDGFGGVWMGLDGFWWIWMNSDGLWWIWMGSGGFGWVLVDLKNVVYLLGIFEVLWKTVYTTSCVRTCVHVEVVPKLLVNLCQNKITPATPVHYILIVSGNGARRVAGCKSIDWR